MTNPATPPPPCSPTELAAAADWVARFAQRWASVDRDALRDLMHEDTQNLVPPMREPADREGVVAHFKQTQALLPDLVLDVVRWAATGDVVMVEWEARATVAGRPLRWTGVDRVRLRDGRTVEGRAYWDTRGVADAVAAALAAAATAS